MCGRLNVIDDPVTRHVSDLLGIRFHAETNRDLRPTQAVDTVSRSREGLQQLTTVWGIRPHWAKQILINAKAETAAEKPMFRSAFANRRCLVPCCGWYEWRGEGGPRKAKYLFTHADAMQPLYMAAIWFPTLPGEQQPRLVTLTTTPNSRCAEYHHRMPVLILPRAIDTWFRAPATQLRPLLSPVSSELIRVRPA